MSEQGSSFPDTPEDFDYSTPEAQKALENVTAFELEIRRQMMRKVRLYESTLGLAVAPTLLRRVLLVSYRRLRQLRQGIK